VAVTLVPLIWLVAVTFTAGCQKIFSADPRIGFLAQAGTLDAQWPKLRQAQDAAEAAGNAAAIQAARQAARVNRMLRFNHRLDAGVAALFLALVSVVLCLSLWEWRQLLGRRRPARLHETPPVWLPSYAVAEGRTRSWWAWAALGMALLRELSGEAAQNRARAQATACACASGEVARAQPEEAAAAVYVNSLEERYRSVRRCC
jgi:carbon starvation protein